MFKFNIHSNYFLYILIIIMTRWYENALILYLECAAEYSFRWFCGRIFMVQASIKMTTKKKAHNKSKKQHWLNLWESILVFSWTAKWNRPFSATIYMSSSEDFLSRVLLIIKNTRVAEVNCHYASLWDH